MVKKNAFFLILNLIAFQAYAGGLEDYVYNIKNQCPDTNDLVIKKSLIEMSQVQHCNSSFTTLLLKNCSRMTCSELLTHLSAFNSSKSGTVIGK